MSKPKTAYLILICIIFFVKQGICQGVPLAEEYNLKVQYKLTFVGDSTNPSKTKSENVLLFTNDNGSFFESLSTFLADSIEILSADPKVARRHLGFSVSNLPIRVLKKNGRLYCFDSFSPIRIETDNIYYQYLEEAIEPQDWKLTDDTVRIGSRLCQVAKLTFGNRNWIAYFDASIPISDGPYKFSGLPGLIIKIHDERSHWCFDLVSLEQTHTNFSNLGTILSKYAKASNKTDYFKSKRYYEKNYMELQEASGTDFISPGNREAIRKNVEKSFMSRSNWIELYP